MGTTFKLWAAMRLWNLGERVVRNARPDERERAIAALREATERLERGG